mgnify:CR=1 FL=1
MKIQLMKKLTNSLIIKASIEIEEIREVPCAKRSKLIQKTKNQVLFGIIFRLKWM